LLVDLAEGFSGSDIEEVCRRLRRLWIVNNTEPEIHDAFRILANVGEGEGEDRRFLSRLRGLPNQRIVERLRERNEKLYSHSVLADLLGVSKSTAYRLSRGEEVESA
jgi:hypothetical protein